MTTITKEIYECVSNSEFQSKITDEALKSRYETGIPIGITFKNVVQSNSIVSLRSLLSFLLLVAIIRSIRSSAQSLKQQGKGGGGNLFMEKSKSKRFQQTVNVKFVDVMGMQKAKE